MTASHPEPAPPGPAAPPPPRLDAPAWLTEEQIFDRMSYADATRAIQSALNAGLDPATDVDRSVLDIDSGQLLLMPSEAAPFVGVKVATVAPGNPALGLDRIHAVYLLFDGRTLEPLAMMDGAGITTLRTPAVSAAVADHLAPAEVEHLVVFGAGPQAWGHIQAMRAIRDIRRVTIVSRDPSRAAALAARVPSAQVGGIADVAEAQLIACATTARTPLFDGNLVPSDSCIIAVGSHEPDARELDSRLMERSQVVVEEPGVAMRESGDVVIPIGEGRLSPEDLVPMRSIITGTVTVDTGRPRVFTSSGMSWEDLVIAAEVFGRG